MNPVPIIPFVEGKLKDGYKKAYWRYCLTGTLIAELFFWWQGMWGDSGTNTAWGGYVMAMIELSVENFALESGLMFLAVIAFFKQRGAKGIVGRVFWVLVGLGSAGYSVYTGYVPTMLFLSGFPFVVGAYLFALTLLIYNPLTIPVLDGVLRMPPFIQLILGFTIMVLPFAALFFVADIASWFIVESWDVFRFVTFTDEWAYTRVEGWSNINKIEEVMK